MKKGMMIGDAIAGSGSTVGHRQQCRRILDSSNMAQSLKNHVDAGYFAACGDIGSILSLEGLTEGDKLNFIDYSCDSLMPLDQAAMRTQFGTIMFLDLPRTLKAQTLSVLLSKGPSSPAFFTMVRQWLIGTLADIPRITWVRTEQNVEIEDRSTAFADWYIDMTALYHGFKDHMTLDFIKQEKAIISNHPLLPSIVQEKILVLLNTVEQERIAVSVSGILSETAEPLA